MFSFHFWEEGEKKITEEGDPCYVHDSVVDDGGGNMTGTGAGTGTGMADSSRCSTPSVYHNRVAPS